MNINWTSEPVDDIVCKMPSSRTMIAIPAFNEKQNIGSVLSGLAELITLQNLQADLVVFDDGSTDNTHQIVCSEGVRVLKSSGGHLGYWNNVRRIIQTAWIEGYAHVVLIDADGQHDPNNITNILRFLDKGYNLVIASRFLDANPPRMTILQWIGCSLYRYVLQNKILDPTSGNIGVDHVAMRCVVNSKDSQLLLDTVFLDWAMGNSLKIIETPGKFYSSPRPSHIYTNIFVALNIFIETISITLSRRYMRNICRGAGSLMTYFSWLTNQYR